MNRLSLLPFEPVPAPEDGWRPEERMLASWIRGHGGSEALAAVAAWLRRAESQGDSCLPLGTPQRCGSPGWDAAVIDTLRGERLVSDGAARAPLVIDAAGRCYWWRSWRHELRIAKVLGARLQVPAADDTRAALVERLFAGSDAAHDQAQRRAVAAADAPLLVLTGGPGTGKTRTALRLLLMRQLLADRAGRGEPLRIALAAPTGKAAHRLNESLQQGAEQIVALDPQLGETCARVLAQPARTVHRLLGWSPSMRRFRHGIEERLAVDLVLLDEVSMLDLGTLRAVCDALPENAGLVLLGDAEQLSSVASGSVLDDVVQALEGRVGGPVVRLDHGFRSDAALMPALGAARQGDADGLLMLCREEAALDFRPLTDATGLSARLDAWAGQLVETIAPLAAGRGEPAARALLAAWQRQQLLCALREGRFGAAAAAEHIDTLIREALGHPPESRLWAGRSVIVLRNDYSRGLFNGDLGVLLPGDDGQLRAWFAPAGSDPALRAFAPGDLPEHASASALTVHKAQGSEYDRIALILPPNPALALLDRQLVYTALSRARHGFELWADEPTLRAALARRSLRQGGLRERLMRA
ncbi:exodeoxyribonuclease V subunit alpha [Pseudomarimonas salicorniae]|uniref:RecBCD enzyme subunit RecD n=1 Tax=Pseudomarimonas salicorniae TaxID=2933270 RepID=A0ABT0GE11_9GAMM|nr:exodeoxyribonuclease V subunit alpha [Lysobacter sp. CAU 1642]MCK7592794.1 exodeoxyribonuclease V subunit alpha [Lysobacter sp. CAU 1642]